MSTKAKDVKAVIEQNGQLDVSRFDEGLARDEKTPRPFNNHYTYIDLGNGVSRSISGFKRIVAYVNPFAIQQGTTPERIGFAPSINSKWWAPSPLCLLYTSPSPRDS